jgi:hypothetical protein
MPFDELHYSVFKPDEDILNWYLIHVYDFVLDTYKSTWNFDVLDLFMTKLILKIF